MGGNILVYSEDSGISLELANGAVQTGSEVSIALLGPGDLGQQASKISVNGVSKVYKAQNEILKDHSPEVVTDALEQIALEANPDFIFIGATRRGKEVAPRLATRLKVGCLTDAQALKIENGRARANRVVWGGNAISSVVTKGKAVITIGPRSYEKAGGSSAPEIKSVSFSPKSRTGKVLGTKPKASGEVNLKDASAIVSAGRGFKKKEDLAILDDLATTLNAVIGASRPLTSDLGWMPESRQVGLSGTTVKPKLYVAVGISGQIQHLTGMRDSKLIVAINNDKNAPIFSECDYGIVGDLYQVVPALTKAIRGQLGR